MSRLGIKGLLYDAGTLRPLLAGANAVANAVQVGEMPSGAVDGSNREFTASRAFIAGTLMVYLNGLLLDAGDYEESSSTLATLTAAPIVGDVIYFRFYPVM